MPHPAPAKKETSVTIPYKKITTRNIEGAPRDGAVKRMLHLPGGRRIITHSRDGSFRVWDLETGMQEEWEDKEIGVKVISLSPDGKTVASGSEDGAVRLWNIDTGKIIKKWMGHTAEVKSVCWSPDGGRVVSGSSDGTFRVWDVESGTTILGPIKSAQSNLAVCYSPDAKIIATGGSKLKVWDANTGELLTTIQEFVSCLEWTSDGKTLIAGGSFCTTKFDTATWSETAFLELDPEGSFHMISLSPNKRILASTSISKKKTTQLWNLETNQRIEPPLNHEDINVTCAAFSADGMFLLIASVGIDAPIYKWDLSTIVKDASLLSNNVVTIRQPAPKIKEAPRPRIPPGFFDGTRRADLSTPHTQSHGQHDSSTPPPRQPSSWRRRFNRHRATGHHTQSWSSPFSWTQNLVSGMVRRRDAQDIGLREPPIVEVPYTAGKPRNYYARKKKPAASYSQTAHAHPIQQPPPNANATASTPPAVAGATGTAGTTTRPHIAFTGWRARLLAWVCCMPVQNAN